VIGTVSSEAKADIARAHGCDHPIVYTREDFAARVRDITGGEGVPVVYDSVGKATFEGSLKCLRRRGVMASFGEASGDPDPMPPRRLGAAARPRRYRIAQDHRIDRAGGVMPNEDVMAGFAYSLTISSAIRRAYRSALQCPVASAANFAGSGGASFPRQTTCMSGRSSRRS
jgi:threonine dehydrogenase-like Zn-dependent dehydrogenase